MLVKNTVLAIQDAGNLVKNMVLATRDVGNLAKTTVSAAWDAGNLTKTMVSGPRLPETLPGGRKPQKMCHPMRAVEGTLPRPSSYHHPTILLPTSCKIPSS